MWNITYFGQWKDALFVSGPSIYCYNSFVVCQEMIIPQWFDSKAYATFWNVRNVKNVHLSIEPFENLISVDCRYDSKETAFFFYFRNFYFLTSHFKSTWFNQASRMFLWKVLLFFVSPTLTQKSSEKHAYFLMILGVSGMVSGRKKCELCCTEFALSLNYLIDLM